MTTEVYFIRHQAGGVAWEMPFLSVPTVQQFEAVAKHFAFTHGLRHPKTGEEFWVKVISVRCIEIEDIIESKPERPAIFAGQGAKAEPAAVTASAVVEVTPPLSQDELTAVADEETT